MIAMHHRAAPARRESACPVVVDLDGALLATDLSHEAAVRFAATRPWQMWKLPLWLLSGRACLTRELARRTELDLSLLPMSRPVVALVRGAQAEGRPVYLATAAAPAHAEAFAARLGGVAGIFAAEDFSLVGQARADRLVAAFGRAGFDYVGSSADDLSVRQAARQEMTLPDRTRIERELLGFAPAAQLIGPRAATRHATHLAALRPHQWAKNLLVFVPVLTSHRADGGTLIAAALAFLAFCAVASSAYLMNDLLDLEADRRHPRKCRRPLAAGDISIKRAVAMAALLLSAGMTVATLLPATFSAVIGAYVLLTWAYSLRLKRESIVDVVTLGLLYTIRVVAGTFAIGTAFSPWLLMFCLFLFLSLAIVKRCSELVMLRDARRQEAAGRGYAVTDLPVMTALAAAAGYGAVLVFALYLSSPEVSRLYAHPLWLWGGCPLLLAWTSRCILLSGRGELHDDPVVFALTDRGSHFVGACIGALILKAL